MSTADPTLLKCRTKNRGEAKKVPERQDKAGKAKEEGPKDFFVLFHFVCLLGPSSREVDSV